MRRFMSFALLSALLPLVVGCTGNGADSQEVFTPPPAMGDAMLPQTEVPGATGRQWLRDGVVLSGCARVEMALNLAVSASEDLGNTTAEYNVGSTRVYETLVMNIAESSRGSRLRLIEDDMNGCDGRQIEPYHATMATSSGRVERFTVMESEELPRAVVGFTSVVTADDGAQVTIERIYAPIVTDGDKPGLLSLATLAEGGSPGSPSPTELLDAALARAGAVIDTAAATLTAPSTATSTATSG
ncbi:hypothetical protein [Actinomyces howellii]|uniref:hypothetical protein n=1 Tax=Actinomyces howellii TaxID=52771 RepID=UPI000F81EF5D|nr:hypothetical protein [Actinomyces howellii]